MNEILQKRIEEAAEEYANSTTSNLLNVFETTGRFEGFNQGATFALQNQWISVEEALPEFQQAVVVTNSEGDYWTSWRLNDNYEDTDDNGFVNNGIGEITHWMPIPSLEGGEE